MAPATSRLSHLHLRGGAQVRLASVAGNTEIRTADNARAFHLLRLHLALDLAVGSCVLVLLLLLPVAAAVCCRVVLLLL